MTKQQDNNPNKVEQIVSGELSRNILNATTAVYYHENHSAKFSRGALSISHGRNGREGTTLYMSFEKFMGCLMVLEAVHDRPWRATQLMTDHTFYTMDNKE